MVIQNIICISLILTLAPVVACSTVVLLDASYWGGSFNPLIVITMAVFGLFTAPIWPTYIPALIITPILMTAVTRCTGFFKIHLCYVIIISLLIGSLAGVAILWPIVLRVLSDHEPTLATNWAIAGAVAGGITLTSIVMVYRKAVVYNKDRTLHNRTPHANHSTRDANEL
jgi:hypothetical protein